MNRRSFLTRSGLAFGALIVGDEALALADRLSHKKVWAGHTFRPQTLVDLAKAYNSPEYFWRLYGPFTRTNALYASLPWKVS